MEPRKKKKKISQDKFVAFNQNFLSPTMSEYKFNLSIFLLRTIEGDEKNI